MVTALATKVASASSTMSLTQEELGRLLKASPRAVSRWRSGESAPQKAKRQRVLDLAYVGEQLARVLQPDDANVWLFSRNPLLDGDTPAARIERGDFDAVLGVIEALTEGVVG